MFILLSPEPAIRPHPRLPEQDNAGRANYATENEVEQRRHVFH